MSQRITELSLSPHLASNAQSALLKARIAELDANYMFEQTRLGKVLKGAQRRYARTWNGGN